MCSLHFTSSDIDHCSGILKKKAIPSIFRRSRAAKAIAREKIHSFAQRELNTQDYHNGQVDLKELSCTVEPSFQKSVESIHSNESRFRDIRPKSLDNMIPNIHMKDEINLSSPLSNPPSTLITHLSPSVSVGNVHQNRSVLLNAPLPTSICSNSSNAEKPSINPSAQTFQAFIKHGLPPQVSASLTTVSTSHSLHQGLINVSSLQPKVSVNHDISPQRVLINQGISSQPGLINHNVSSVQGLINQNPSPLQGFLHQAVQSHKGLTSQNTQPQPIFINRNVPSQSIVINQNFLAPRGLINHKSQPQPCVVNGTMHSRGLVNHDIRPQPRLVNHNAQLQLSFINQNLQQQKILNQNLQPRQRLLKPNTQIQMGVLKQSIHSHQGLLNQNAQSQPVLIKQNSQLQPDLVNQNIQPQKTLVNQNVQSQRGLLSQNTIQLGLANQNIQNIQPQQSLVNSNIQPQLGLVKQNTQLHLGVVNQNLQLQHKLVNQSVNQEGVRYCIQTENGLVNQSRISQETQVNNSASSHQNCISHPVKNTNAVTTINVSDQGSSNAFSSSTEPAQSQNSGNQKAFCITHEAIISSEKIVFPVGDTKYIFIKCSEEDAASTNKIEKINELRKSLIISYKSIQMHECKIKRLRKEVISARIEASQSSNTDVGKFKSELESKNSQIANLIDRLETLQKKLLSVAPRDKDLSCKLNDLMGITNTVARQILESHISGLKLGNQCASYPKSLMNFCMRLYLKGSNEYSLLLKIFPFLPSVVSVQESVTKSLNSGINFSVFFNTLNRLAEDGFSKDIPEQISDKLPPMRKKRATRRKC